ncbi:hypothetical protein [Streptomyces phaeochromogenes]
MFDLVLGAAVVALAATHLYRPKSKKVRIAKDAMTVLTVMALLAVWSQL